MKRYALGLTGSIGMGKSTTADFFRKEGCDVWDADAAVHRLYDGAAVAPMAKAFPQAVINNAVSRDALREIISQDPSALAQIEAIVHPLVAEDRDIFVDRSAADILVFDIPLLFETNGHQRMDGVACVDVDPEVQKARVLARGTMSEAQFEQIRSKQMPNAEKSARSDFVILTDTLEHAKAQVQDIVRQIRESLNA